MHKESDMLEKTLTTQTALTLGAAMFAAAPASAEIFHQIVITGDTPAERAQIRRVIRAHGGHQNDAAVVQRGKHNSAGIRQKGRGHRAIVGQYGNGNAATVDQRGRNHTAAVIQFGDSAGSVVRQRGRNGYALVYVFGKGTVYDTASWAERGR
jgi:major curlin subunit